MYFKILLRDIKKHNYWNKYLESIIQCIKPKIFNEKDEVFKKKIEYKLSD